MSAEITTFVLFCTPACKLVFKAQPNICSHLKAYKTSLSLSLLFLPLFFNISNADVTENNFVFVNSTLGRWRSKNDGHGLMIHMDAVVSAFAERNYLASRNFTFNRESKEHDTVS